MTPEFSTERRREDRRQQPIPRSGVARRTGSGQRDIDRRVKNIPVAPERRSDQNPRGTQRRFARRRSFGFDRRVGDRRSDAPGPYTRREIIEIRQVLFTAPGGIPCPRCKGPLEKNLPVARETGTVREVHCLGCQRQLSIPDYTMARILVVDDEELVRHALSRMLRKAGHEVVAAADGESGLRSYTDTKADVVLVDMRMPGMDGIEFMRRCRSRFPDAKMIGMSGGRRHGTRDPLAMARSVGATNILRKPFTAQDLLTMVDEALGVSVVGSV